jgi:hypothetical protein
MIFFKIIFYTFVIAIIYAAVSSIDLRAAESWNTPNDWFGRDVIVNEPCRDNPDMKQAYSYTGDMIMSRACWYQKGDNIHIVYNDRRMSRVYPISAFKTKGFGWF